MTRDPRPWTLTVAVAVLLIETAVFAVLAVALGVDAVRQPDLVPEIAAVLAFAVLIAAGTAAIAVALLRRRRWARGPAVAWSILLGLVGAGQFSVNPLVAGVAVVIAIGGALAAAAPATRDALRGPDDPDAPRDPDGTDSRADAAE